MALSDVDRFGVVVAEILTAVWTVLLWAAEVAEIDRLLWNFWRRNEDPAENVECRPGNPAWQAEQEKEEAEDHRIELEIFSQTAANTGNLALVQRAGQFFRHALSPQNQMWNYKHWNGRSHISSK